MKCPYCIKVCSKCGNLLVANTMNFHKEKKGKYGLKVQCKKCIAQYKAQYYQDHQEYYAQYKAQYYQDHQEYYAQRHAQYYQDNKEHKAQYQAQYYQTPQGKLAHKNAKHRRRTKTKQGKGYTLEQKQELLDFFKGCDAYTGKPMKEVSIDHIVPINKGGEHEVWNLVPMEKALNSSKSSKNMEKWFKKQPFYNKERLQKIYEWMEYAKNKYSTM